jgi:glycosyltransferase involved in cell wall biosynthesis
MVSPHMSPLAISLAEQGYKVNYIAEMTMSRHRIKTGWKFNSLQNVNVIIANDNKKIESIISNSPKDSIHICQGLRGNGKVKIAQKFIRKLKRREWIILETIDDKFFFGFLKRLVYRVLSIYYHNKFEAILAIGHNTNRWLIERGFNQKKIFPFAYFLSKPKLDKTLTEKSKEFEFLFIGNLITRKKIDLLIRALSLMKDKKFHLKIVGNGPQYNYLKKLTNTLLMDKKLIWVGLVEFNKIPSILANADCLVLPSRHDGWGAVVSESLLSGTPAICSNSCGVSEIIFNTKYGRVFNVNNIDSLFKELTSMFEFGKLNIQQRKDLKTWSECLSSEYGAKYFIEILNFVKDMKIQDKKPTPPWKK